MTRKMPWKMQPKVRCERTAQQSTPLEKSKVALLAAVASVAMPPPLPHDKSATVASLHTTVATSNLSLSPLLRGVAVAGKLATGPKEGLQCAQSICDGLLFGFRDECTSSCSAMNRSRTLRQVHEEALSYPWPLVNSAAVGTVSARPPYRLPLLKRHKKRRKREGDLGGGEYEGDDEADEGEDVDEYARVEDDEDDLDGAAQWRGCGAKRRREQAQRLPHGCLYSEHQLAMAAAETRRLEGQLEAQVRDNNRR